MTAEDHQAFWHHLNDARAVLRAIDDLDDPFGAEFQRTWAELQALDEAVDGAMAAVESERTGE